MKRFFSFLVVGLVGVLPFAVKAATTIAPDCTSVDSNGNRTCTISANLDTALETITVTLTENGGADITSITNVDNSEWNIGTPTESNGVHTVNLTYVSLEPSHSGETTLFKFVYKVSGEKDCSVAIGLGNATASTPATDTTTPNKQTGLSVPYIALGGIALLAVGAYLTTKSKAKMFNI